MDLSIATIVDNRIAGRNQFRGFSSGKKIHMGGGSRRSKSPEVYMKKTADGMVVKFAVDSKIDLLRSELNAARDLSAEFGVPSSDVVDELEARLEQYVDLAKGLYIWEELMDDLEKEILTSLRRRS